MIFDIPRIRQEGYEALMNGRAFGGPSNPDGFCLNPYKPGSIERENFQAGCIYAALKIDIRAPIMVGGE